MPFVNGMLVGSDGRIVTSQAAVAAGDPTSGAFRYDPATGAVKAAVAVPQYYANGFGFNAGQLCLGAGPVTLFRGGLPFNALGQLVSDGVGGIASYNWGWPLSPGGLVIQPITPPVTWNPADKSGNIALSNNNMTMASAAAPGRVRATSSHSAGKYYVEFKADGINTGTNSPQMGLLLAGMPVTGGSWGFGGDNGYGTLCAPGMYIRDPSGSRDCLTGFAAADVFGMAVDFAAGIWFARNNGWVLSGNPATGANPNFTGIAGSYFPAAYANVGQATVRFSPADWTYAPPAGFGPW